MKTAFQSHRNGGKSAVSTVFFVDRIYRTFHPKSVVEGKDGDGPIHCRTTYGDSAKPQHATVQKLLDRLKAKGSVARDRTVWPHIFRPAVQQGELIDRRLQSTADKFCGGAMQPLLTHLLRGKKLSKDDRSSLRNLLDELDSEE